MCSVEDTRVRFVTSMVSLVTGVLLASCYLTRIDLVEERGVTLAVTPEGNVSMSAVSAYQEGEHLLIAGVIWQKQAAWRFSGWVYISVILDSGEVFEERCSRILPKPGPPQQVHMEHLHASFFEVTLPKVPPPDSVLRVVGSARASFCTQHLAGAESSTWIGVVAGFAAVGSSSKGFM